MKQIRKHTKNFVIEINLEEVLPVVAVFALLFAVAAVVTFIKWYDNVADSSLWYTAFWGGLAFVMSAVMIAIMIVLDEDKNQENENADAHE